MASPRMAGMVIRLQRSYEASQAAVSSCASLAAPLRCPEWLVDPRSPSNGSAWTLTPTSTSRSVPAANALSNGLAGLVLLVEVRACEPPTLFRRALDIRLAVQAGVWLLPMSFHSFWPLSLSNLPILTHERTQLCLQCISYRE